MGAMGSRLWITFVVAVGLVVIVSTYRDYGIGWDDPVQSFYGESVERYFRSGFEDRSAIEFIHMRFYGPLFELAAALVYGGSPPERKYEIRHLLCALTALLAVVGTIRLAGLLGGGWGGVYSPLILITMPRFYGHAFVNSKDIPFLCLFVWSVYTSCRLALERGPGRRVVACGFALGAALGARPGGLPLLLLMFVAVVGLAAVARAQSSREALGEIGRLAGPSVGVWGLAWGVMVAFWPWAHENPFANPLHAIQAAMSFPDAYRVLFEGQGIMSDELPRRYLSQYLLITTPPAVLGLAVLGLVRSLRLQLRAPRGRRALVCFALELWLFTPLIVAAILRPNVYDGMRHVLFVLPALALLAGMGASWAVDAGGSPWGRRAVAAAMLLLVLLPLPSLVRLHPYQLAYFNAFVGGVRGAQERYDTEYWLLSYKEAMEWINRQADEVQGGGLKILVAVNHYSYDCAAQFLAPGVEMAKVVQLGLTGALPEPFRYYVATRRYGFDRNFPDSPVVHTVGRDGAVFTVVRGREPHTFGLPGRTDGEVAPMTD